VTSDDTHARLVEAEAKLKQAEAADPHSIETVWWRAQCISLARKWRLALRKEER